MKKFIVVLILSIVVIPAWAAVYTDATNDLDSAVNNDNLNFTGAEVTNDVTTISFKINILGDIQSVNWGKYMIGIDSATGGDTNGNAWLRPISMSSGMNYWLGGWVDASSDNVQLWNYNNGEWTNTAVYTSTINQYSVVYTIPLSALGLAPGNSFTFDIYSSGGGGNDTAIDALSLNTPTVTGWSEPYDSGANVSTYTIPIPEPTLVSILLLGLGILFARR